MSTTDHATHFSKMSLVAELAAEICICYEHESVTESVDLQDPAWQHELYKHVRTSSRVLPYLSASCFNDIHVLLELMSQASPSKGTPGGFGIGVVVFQDSRIWSLLGSGKRRHCCWSEFCV